MSETSPRGAVVFLAAQPSVDLLAKALSDKAYRIEIIAQPIVQRFPFERVDLERIMICLQHIFELYGIRSTISIQEEAVSDKNL